MRMREGGKTVQLANAEVSVPTGSIRAGRTAAESTPSLKPTGIDGPTVLQELTDNYMRL